jgi:hypothetical protein
MDHIVTRILPWGSLPGLVVMTNLKIYFRAYYNDTSGHALHKFNLPSFISLHKRRHMLRFVSC